MTTAATLTHIGQPESVPVSRYEAVQRGDGWTVRDNLTGHQSRHTTTSMLIAVMAAQSHERGDHGFGGALMAGEEK